MRVFKLKAFARFQHKERIGDAALAKAIDAAERGLIDADLGGGLIKQRVARPGTGKRGGYRMMIAFRSGDKAIFLFGFPKNEIDNIQDDELQALRIRGQTFLSLSGDRLTAMIAEGNFEEISYESK